MAPTSQSPKPSGWFVVAVVFIALFMLLLLGSLLVLGYLYHQKKQRRDINPYSYGSENWLDYERATAAQAERDALAIVNLESRISVQEQYNQEADRMIELLDRNQKHLTLQLRDEQRRSEPVDPDVFQRVYDNIHKPLEPPRPSLPPLVANSMPATQRTPLSPIFSRKTPVLSRTIKLRDIIRRNSKSGPARSVHIVEHPVQPLSATLVDSGWI